MTFFVINFAHVAQSSESNICWSFTKNNRIDAVFSTDGSVSTGITFQLNVLGEEKVGVYTFVPE